MNHNFNQKDNYMTVGELAEKMGVSVRTLQYYDRQGLLCPSAKSGGGRRLYTDKDMLLLHQILSLKSLGFSLEEIKTNLISLDSPAEVAEMLNHQAKLVREKIERLSESLYAIEALKKEVLDMHAVNFQKYADIIVNLQMKNEYYWLIKHFDDETLGHIRKHFDKKSGLDFINRFQTLCEEALMLEKMHTRPETKEAQNLAKRFWDLVVEFTGGDMRLLPKLMEFGNSPQLEPDMKEKLSVVNRYLEPALQHYFSQNGIQPWKEESE